MTTAQFQLYLWVSIGRFQIEFDRLLASHNLGVINSSRAISDFRKTVGFTEWIHVSAGDSDKLE